MRDYIGRKSEQLMELYEIHWADYSSVLGEIASAETNDKLKPAYPLLLTLNRWQDHLLQSEDWYTGADIKVMLIGQETNEWAGDCDDFGTPPSKVFDPEISLGAVAGIYENFWSSHYRDGKFDFRNKYGSFHYGLNQIISLIDAKFAPMRVGYIWNNIIKTGKAKGSGAPSSAIYEAELKYFNVIQEEIQILQPDILIFLTGGYDQRIRDKFGSVFFEAVPNFAVNEVATISGENIHIPAFRTYHPAALRGREDMLNRFQAIVNLL